MQLKTNLSFLGFCVCLCDLFPRADGTGTGKGETEWVRGADLLVTKEGGFLIPWKVNHDGCGPRSKSGLETHAAAAMPRSHLESPTCGLAADRPKLVLVVAFTHPQPPTLFSF